MTEKLNHITVALRSLLRQFPDILTDDVVMAALKHRAESPKTAAERGRAFRERQREAKAEASKAGPVSVPKTSAERVRAYREREKKRNGFPETLPYWW